MKQYVTCFAYTGNTEISFYENGTKMGSVILDDYDVGGYIQCLESQGYVRAFDVQRAQEEVAKAKEEYEFALSELERAKAAPLIVLREGSVL